MGIKAIIKKMANLGTQIPWVLGQTSRLAVLSSSKQMEPTVKIDWTNCLAKKDIILSFILRL